MQSLGQSGKAASFGTLRRGVISGVQRLREAFRPPAGGNVALYRNGTSYWLCQAISGGVYWAIEMFTGSYAGSATCTNIRKSEVQGLAIAYDDQAASSVRTGTWVQPNIDAASFGGSYAYTQTAGAYLTFTSPPGTTRAGMIYFGISNAGFAKIAIDGDPTRATLIKTAQQLVTAGTLDPAALVANGGTLNPTDRVFSQYLTPQNKNVPLLFADDLTPGVHTVTVAYTGYKQTAAGGTRVYVTAMLAGGPATALTDANVYFGLIYNCLGATASDYEYALEVTPTGGVTQTFIGGGHGYDYTDTETYQVDGVTVTPTDGQIIAGVSTVGYLRTSHLRHPDVLGSNFATSATTLTMTLRDGLRKQERITWTATGASWNNSYMAMLPLNGGTFNLGSIAGTRASYSLTNDNGLFAVNARSNLAYEWDTTTGYAGLLSIPDVGLTVNNWKNAVNPALAIEDRVGGVWNKIYLARTDSSHFESIAIGDVWQSDVSYQIARLPVGYLWLGNI